MANVDRPNGLVPVGTISGAPWQGSVVAFQLDGSHSAIYTGDMVKMTADGYLDVYAAGDTQFIGVCVGKLPATATTVGGIMGDNSLSNSSPTLSGGAAKYSAANAQDVILVCVAPDAIYEVQEDGDTDPLELADVGQNVEIVNGGGSTTTGLSGMELNSDTHNTTNTLPLRILGMAQKPGNELGDTASAASRPVNCRWLVTPANHALKGLNVAI